MNAKSDSGIMEYCRTASNGCGMLHVCPYGTYEGLKLVTIALFASGEGRVGWEGFGGESCISA